MWRASSGASSLRRAACCGPALPWDAPPSCAAGCRFFYASSACIYPEGRQLNTEVEGGGLKEEDAWPAQVLQIPCLVSYHSAG